jgi:hypothetical protein
MLLLNQLHTNIDKVNFKKRLLKQCVEMIKQRIAAAALAIENAQSAANAEEKSSAGDKYETSRAMSHLEKDMYSRQLLANQQELEALLTVDCDKLYDSIKIGSFVFCKDVAFFIAAGLGKINFEGIELYLVSPLAPMAKMVFNKKVGAIFTFKKMELFIKATF